MRRIAVAGVLLLAGAALAGVLRPEGAQAVRQAVAQTDTVSVIGMGSVSAVPDRALISAGVESSADTAKAALAANAREMRKVIDALRAAGAKNVTTQTVSLSPRVTPEGKPNGFSATNIVSATTTLDGAGALIDTAVDAGANTVYGPSLTQSDAARLYKLALKKAVADARERADALAEAAGRQVGRVISMSESGAAPGPVYEKAASTADSTPVVAGEQETTASVSVTFELR
jgi:hypothetical protein